MIINNLCTSSYDKIIHLKSRSNIKRNVRYDQEQCIYTGKDSLLHFDSWRVKINQFNKSDRFSYGINSNVTKEIASDFPQITQSYGYCIEVEHVFCKCYQYAFNQIKLVELMSSAKD